MKLIALLTATSLLLIGIAPAATIFGITADSTNDPASGASFSAGGLAALTSDGFSYNP